MSKLHTLFPVVACALALSVGCGKGDESASGDKPAAGGKAASGKPAAAKPKPFAPLKLDVLGGLQVDAPDGATVMDSSADAPNVMVSSETCTVMVSTVTMAYPSSFEAAEKSIKGDPNPFQKFTKSEQTADGWHFEFELKSMMDDSPLYGIQVRKKIGDKEYECGRNERDKAMIECARKVCLSLRK